MDKLDLDKLVPVSVDLSKLSDVVKNDVVKKDLCNKLVTKINNKVRIRKKKFLIPAVSLKRLIIILKSLK